MRYLRRLVWAKARRNFPTNWDGSDMRYTLAMESTQKTTKGAEIPVPKRDDWEKVLRKAANSKPKGSTTDRPPTK